MNEDQPTVVDIIDQVKEQICDSYCKWFDHYCGVYKDIEEAQMHMMDEKCDSCPLGRLS